MVKKAIIFSIFIAFVLSSVNAQMPTKWRGINGNGIYNETGLLKEWPANGPEILWAFDNLGKGYSSPVVANGLIYVSSMIEENGLPIRECPLFCPLRAVNGSGQRVSCKRNPFAFHPY